jgi:hypothetical protein
MYTRTPCISVTIWFFGREFVAHDGKAFPQPQIWPQVAADDKL